MHTNIHIHTFRKSRLHSHSYKHTYVQVLHAYIQTHKYVQNITLTLAYIARHTCIRSGFTHLYTHTYKHIYIHMFRFYTLIHAYIKTHIHTYVQVLHAAAASNITLFCEWDFQKSDGKGGMILYMYMCVYSIYMYICVICTYAHIPI